MDFTILTEYFELVVLGFIFVFVGYGFCGFGRKYCCIFKKNCAKDDTVGGLRRVLVWFL